MDSGNVSQLVLPNTAPVENRKHIEGVERDVEFLSLRLLNKRGRVRLSPAGLDYNSLPGSSTLLSVGNIKGWLAAAVRKEDSSNHILVSTLGDLRTAFESGQANPEPFIPFTPRRSLLSVPGTPVILKFALNDERLLIGFLEGPIFVYNTNDLFASTERSQPTPIHTFPGDASTIPRDISPNPGESPELVAILRGVHGQEPGHHIDVVDVQQLKHIAGWRKGNEPNAAPVSISWSPKGKQIAIGLQSGDMLLYSPLSPGNPKSHLLKPPSTPPAASSLLATMWLSNPTFHTIFSSPEASSTLFDPSTSDLPTSTHFISTHDSKSRSAIDVELRDPCPPFGAKRPPGPLSVVLRNWAPTKYIIFCGDGPSADIGVIGTFPNPSDPSDDGWGNFILEETSTPSLPLDDDMNDTALLGLEMDLTSSKPVRMSEQPDDGTPDLPPSPILYAYASDGTVVAWHVLNSNGEAYPGMSAAGQASPGPTASPMLQQQESVKSFGMPSPRVSPPASPTPAPLFRPAQAFGSSTPAFGQGTSSPTSQAASPASGFSAFSSTNPTSKFGSTGFGFGTSAAPSAFGQPPAAPAFGSTGFGVGSSPQPEKPKSAPSPGFGSTGFGQAAAAPAFGTSTFGSKPAAPAFGQSGFGAPSSGVTKPAGGFGSATGGFASFASQGTSAFAPVNSSALVSKPATSVFGQGGFGQATSPPPAPSAFGTGGQGQASSPSSAFKTGGTGQALKAATPPVSAFGQQQASQPTPAFGAFGQQAMTPAFGKTGFGNSESSSPSQSGSFGGFGALGDALKTSPSPAMLDSPPGSPTSPGGSPPGSPELRASSQPPKPTSSYLKPAEGFGSFVKPAEGFGAFGNKSSSFVKPAEGFGSSSQQKLAAPTLAQQKPIAPAFGSTGFGASTPPTAAPTFGSTSALGRKPLFGTSSFGSSPQPAASEPSKPITGGFSAFSSGGGGFASFANPGKPASFGDVLSSGEKDKPESDATTLAFGGTPVSKSSDAPAFGVPKERKLSSTAPAEKPKVVSDEEGETGEERFSEDELASQEPSSSPTKSEDPSFSLLSLGEATPRVGSPSVTTTPGASFEKVDEFQSEPEGADENKESAEDGDETASEPFSLTDDGIDESASEEEQEPRSPTRSLSEEETEEAIHVPLPETPQDETPRSTPAPASISSERDVKTPEVKVSSPSPELPRPASAVDEHEDSTTPPGSPVKPITTAAPVAPKPVLPTSTASPFGLGMGRPSSRPIRSSPLASAPVTSADDEDPARDMPPSKSAPEIAKIQSADPKAPFGQWSPSAPAPATAPPASPADGPSTAKLRRPKTPPLLGTSPSTSGPKLMPLGSPFTLGQPQMTPVPLQRPIPPLQPPVTAPVSSVPSQPTPKDEEEELPKHPMQIEFLRAYQEMTKELVQLYKKDQEMALLRPIISEPRGLEKLVLNNQEFVPGKYSSGDLQAFAAMIGTLQKRVIPLLQQGNANKRLLRDLQHLALISETKQEEVSRWVRAREDPEFAKTLKPRTLGPEHSENQVRLRKAVQTARDRIQQCEDEMEALKKRLDQHKSGKVGFRPPSLDTIDRTCRNIQLALEERTKLLEQLQDRIEALSPKASQRLQSFPGPLGSPVLNPGAVTPPFASVAAAALNSERSSLRLKNALLSTRREPLLTTKVTKLEPSKSATRSAQLPAPSQRPEWKLPPVPALGSSSSSPLSSPSVSRRGGRSEKRHGAVQFKASMPSPSAKSAAFDWGPLPGAAPLHQLSMDVRSQRGRETSSFAKQDVGEDSEWDQEAQEDYQAHH